MKPESAQRDCDWFDERLEAFIDHELSPDEHHLVAEHVSSCPACGAMLHQVQSVKQTLGTLPQLECPDHVIRAVEASVAPEVAIEIAPRQARSRWRYAAIGAALAASLLVALQTERPPEPSTKAQQAQQVEKTLAELRIRTRDLGRTTFEKSLARPARSIATSLGSSQLGRWSATAARLLSATRPTIEPSDRSDTT